MCFKRRDCIIMDRLIFGLPAIANGDKYIIYSPYAQGLITIPQDQIDSVTREDLEKHGLFKLRNPFYNINDHLLTLVITNQCNLSCKYCYENALPQNRLILDEKIAIASVDYMAERYGTHFRILLHGGEPTLGFSMIRKLWKHIESNYKNNDILIHLISNGAFSEEIAHEIVNMNFSLTISHDGTAGIQKKHRPLISGEDSTEIVERNIKFFVENQVPLQILSIITEETVNQMPEIVNYVSSLGVKRLRLEPLITYGRAKGCTLTPPNGVIFAEKFEEALDTAKAQGVRLVNAAVMNLIHPEKRYCNCSMDGNLVIGANGDVLMCHEVNDANEEEKKLRIAGRFTEENNDFIIDFKKVEHYRELTCKENNTTCQNCFAASVCGGGCPTRNMTYTGEAGTLDKNLCDMRKIMLKKTILRMYERI